MMPNGAVVEHGCANTGYEWCAFWRDHRGPRWQARDRPRGRLPFATGQQSVSRHHCALLLDDYTLRIRDLGSKNGTFVNGRIGSADTFLLHYDVISMGETIFRIDLNQAGAPMQPAAPESQAPFSSPALEGTGIFVRYSSGRCSAPCPSDRPTRRLSRQTSWRTDHLRRFERRSSSRWANAGKSVPRLRQMFLS
jgi:hypothetical protein